MALRWGPKGLPVAKISDLQLLYLKKWDVPLVLFKYRLGTKKDNYELANLWARKQINREKNKRHRNGKKNLKSRKMRS